MIMPSIDHERYTAIGHHLPDIAKWISHSKNAACVATKSPTPYRRLFASLAISQGVDIVTVSGALGHTNPNVTLGVYSHMFQDSHEKISDAVVNALDFGH